MKMIPPRSKIIGSAVLIFAGVFISNIALGEGRCPAGQYPIGDSRAPGCAPIPEGGGHRFGSHTYWSMDKNMGCGCSLP
jgi:hypothetical protein